MEKLYDREENDEEISYDPEELLDIMFPNRDDDDDDDLMSGESIFRGD